MLLFPLDCEWTAIDEHEHSSWVGSNDCFDQLVLSTWETKICSVVILRLLDLMKSCEDHSDISVGSCCHCFPEQWCLSVIVLDRA